MNARGGGSRALSLHTGVPHATGDGEPRWRPLVGLYVLPCAFQLALRVIEIVDILRQWYSGYSSRAVVGRVETRGRTAAVEMHAPSPYIRVGRSSAEARALDVAKRSVNCSARNFLAAWGRGNAGPVPCAGCSACCYYAGVPVDKKRDRSRLPHLLTERNHDGELVLRRRADGACAHLGDRGCMIYEHRPSACRSFDCRAFSAMGLVEHCDPNHRTPDWEFAAPERAPP